MTRFFWPVCDCPFTLEPLVVFFDYGDAAEFVRASDATLYIGEPRYDRRESGYLPPQEQLTDIEHLGPGRIAA